MLKILSRKKLKYPIIFTLSAVGWFVLYKIISDTIPPSQVNPLIIYGYVITNALLLVILKNGISNNNDDSETYSHEKRLVMVFYTIGFLVLNLIFLLKFDYAFFHYANATRELGHFLGVIENMNAGLWPNVSYPYLYGVLPVYLSFALTKIIYNYFFALFFAKILLDLGALYLIYYLFKDYVKKIHQLLLLIILSCFQVFFLSPGSLHASPIRYLILLAPLLFIVKYKKTNNKYYLYLYAASPFVLFLMSPEVGLISFVYSILLIGLLFYENFRRNLILVSVIQTILIGLIVAIPATSKFFYNSIYYARSVVGGIISYKLPVVINLLKNAYQGRSFDGVSELVINSLFYVYLIPLSVLLFVCIKYYIQVLREKRALFTNEIMILSLSFFAFLYFFKALGGYVTTAYQSLTLIFIIIAFTILNQKYSRMAVIKYSWLVLLFYAMLNSLLNFYFFGQTATILKGLPDCIDPRSRTVVKCTNKERNFMEDLRIFASDFAVNEKILVLSDNSPGISYFINKPNYTTMLFPPYMAYNDKLRGDLASQLIDEKIKYLILPLMDNEFIFPERRDGLKNFIDDNLGEHYRELKKNDTYIVYELIR